jgi:hypothetical protein
LINSSAPEAGDQAKPRVKEPGVFVCGYAQRPGRPLSFPKRHERAIFSGNCARRALAKPPRFHYIRHSARAMTGCRAAAMWPFCYTLIKPNQLVIRLIAGVYGVMLTINNATSRD